MSAATENIVGRRYGRLVVVSRAPAGKRGVTRWNCRCDCGNKATVFASNIRSGYTKSCGCIHREAASATSLIHGDSHRSGSLYSRWCNMRRRCLDPDNPAYRDYGARGISVHREWVEDYAAFRDWMTEHMGPCPAGHSLDRIDNDGNYEPGNLRWADRTTQARNTRRKRPRERCPSTGRFLPRSRSAYYVHLEQASVGDALQKLEM